MLTAVRKDFGNTLGFGDDFPDGRLTEPSDGKRYEWRKMIEKVKNLGRPLTKEESEEFRIK